MEQIVESRSDGKIMNNDEFLQLIQLSKTDLADARIEIASLREIFDDYEKRQLALLDTGEYIQRSLGRLPGVHSTRVRIKSSISLARKVVRKRKENSERDIRLDNYADEIRDLIGLRAFHLFKNEWKMVHDNIVETWNLHPEENQPLAYIRRGDDPSLQQAFKDARCKVIEKEAGYRSVHYILQTCAQKEPCNAEIQVRTLFEEAWSEIDHQVRYPDNGDDAILNDYLLILNRLAGGADEMASLLLRVKAELLMWRSLKEGEEVKRGQTEAELSQVKEELARIMTDLSLTREQKDRLQKQFDKIPHIYRQSPEEMQKVLVREAAEAQRKIASLIGGRTGSGLIDVAMSIDQRKYLGGTDLTKRISEYQNLVNKSNHSQLRKLLESYETRRNDLDDKQDDTTETN